MNLKQISDDILNQQLKNLVRRERELLGDILRHIREIDRRRLHLSMGYPSLFAYMTEFLGYSAGSAQRRIDAARLLQELPEVSDLIETGKVNLSQVSLLQQSAREAKKIYHTAVTSDQKLQTLLKMQNMNQKQSQVLVSQSFDLPIVDAPVTRHQADESVRIEVTLSKEQWAKVQEMQEILSNSVNSKDMSELITYLADKVIQKRKLKLNKSVGSIDFPNELNLRLPNPTSAVEVKSGRTYIPTTVKNRVFANFSSCQYHNKSTGKLCGNRLHLQLDHIQPVWANGGNSIDNLTVLCGSHNRHKYRVQAGLGYL